MQTLTFYWPHALLNRWISTGYLFARCWDFNEPHKHFSPFIPWNFMAFIDTFDGFLYTNCVVVILGQWIWLKVCALHRVKHTDKWPFSFALKTFFIHEITESRQRVHQLEKKIHKTIGKISWSIPSIRPPLTRNKSKHISIICWHNVAGKYLELITKNRFLYKVSVVWITITQKSAIEQF